jgi:hypothetical protein
MISWLFEPREISSIAFVGVLISPLHLCLLLSNEYFGTSLMPVYRHMWMPLTAMLGSGAAYFGGLYIGWLEMAFCASFRYTLLWSGTAI